MMRKNLNSKNLLLSFLTFCSIINPYYIPLVAEDSLENLKSKSSINSNTNDLLKSEYLLGPGDGLNIYFDGIQIFSNFYIVDSEGNLNLPEIEKINVIGKTIIELKEILTSKYKEYIFDPNLTIVLQVQRPVTIFLGGEVLRPGLYTFKNNNQNNIIYNDLTQNKTQNILEKDKGLVMQNQPNVININPKIYDALKLGRGISNYADLSNIKVLRNNSQSQGGGKIETSINLTKLLKEGDQTQNIRLYDGDAIIISKSEKLLSEQLLEINRTNITPDTMQIYISGNILEPGRLVVEQGTSLVQAVFAAGGEKYFTGKVRHVRFYKNGTSEQRYFNYDAKARVNSYNNPIILEGDIIQINKNVAGKIAKSIKEVTAPVVGLYTLLNIFE